MLPGTWGSVSEKSTTARRCLGSLRKDPKDRWQSAEVMYTVLAAQKQKLDSGAFSNPSFVQPPVRPASQPPSPPPGSVPPVPPAAPLSQRELRAQARGPRRVPRWVWIIVGLSIAYWGMCNRPKTVRVTQSTPSEAPAVEVTPAPPVPAGASSAPAPESQAPGVLTDQSIMDMVEAGVPEAV